MAKSQRSTFGSTRQLPSKRWQARWRDEEGTLHAIPGTFPTQREADDALAEVRVQVRSGAWWDASVGEVLFRDYAEKILKERRAKLAVRTLEEYRRMLRLHILPTFGHRQIGSISVDDVESWHSGLLERISKQHTRNVYFVMSGIMTQAVRRKVIPHSPCIVENAGAMVKSDLPTFEVDHVRAVIEAAPEKHHPMLWMAFGGHTRVGELLALKREDYDSVTGRLRINKQLVPITVGGQTIDVETAPKHGSIRSLIVLPIARTAMTEYLEANPKMPTAPLFAGPAGDRITRAQVASVWTKARRAAGVDEMRFHDLRHVGLTLMAVAGTTPKELMRRAGHSTIAASLAYQHAADNRDAELVERADRLMA